jgi:short-subunit dehydrogenase
LKLKDRKILLTGAAGGIGSALARELIQAGAQVALLDRDEAALDRLADELQTADNQVFPISVDLLDSDSREQAIRQAETLLGHIDVLVNGAGLMSYRAFAEEDPLLLERIMQLNTIAPMLLTRQLLPSMLKRGSGQVVNIGSTFGSIAFAWFAAYSASKFALRGFSEALRRELAGSGVSVTYIAPRAVRTKLNTEAVYQMAQATGMNMDSPDKVAQQIAQAIAGGRKDVYLGFPESWFVRINALFPRLVDKALRKQNATMYEFTRRQTS